MDVFHALMGLLSLYHVEIWIAISLLLSALSGYLYDTKIVEYVEREWPDSDVTADLVVGGVFAVVVISMPVLGLLDAVYMLGLFAASGVFMVWGSKRRINMRRKEGHDALRDDLEQLIHGFDQRGHDDDAT